MAISKRKAKLNWINKQLENCEPGTDEFNAYLKGIKRLSGTSTMLFAKTMYEKRYKEKKNSVNS